MLEIIGGIVVLGAIATGFFTLSKNMDSKDYDIDVVSDYMKFKSALLKFRKEEKRKCESLKELEKYIEKSEDIKWEYYNITVDEKYLVVKGAKHFDAKNIIKRVGGTSYINGNKIYLSFLSLTKVSKVEPVAKFKIIPSENIYTTTNIEYDTSETVVEDGKVVEYKWEDKEPRFKEPGTYIVRLKVKDINGNWSNWYEREILVLEKKGIKSISCGYEFAYIIHENGSVDVVGRNDSGQLALGHNEFVDARKFSINLENVESISAGEDHALIRTYDRKIYAVGNNKKGQLGLGTKINSKIPKEIWGLEFIKQVEAGKNFSGALTVSGSVFTWGDNEYGQLGNETSLMRDIPKKIDAISNIKQISFGNKHALALTYDGMVYSWGCNKYGQLGVGYKGKNLEPTLSEFKNIVYICAGKDTSYAINENGRVYVCGKNSSNQLGIDGERELVFPKENLNLKKIVTVESKGDFAVAVDEVGRVYTWGRYRHTDREFENKPTLIEGLKYIKSICTSLDKAYVVDEKDCVYAWSSIINDKEKLELKIEEE